MKAGNNDSKPKFLCEICGHDKITDYLKSAISNNHVAHSYVFSGGDSLGKKTVVDRFVKSLYCAGTGEHQPCNECPACRQVASGVHPDIYHIRRLIDEKTGKLKREISVEQVRDLKMKLSQGTLFRSWKIAIIEEAETLNLNSANSLLKVLEEPSPKTVIILVTNDSSKLIKTISSRCQTLNFLPVKKSDIKDYLLSRELSQERAERIAHLALGRPGVAVNLAEDGDFMSDMQKQFHDFLGVLKTDIHSRWQSMGDLLNFEKDESLNIMKLNEMLDNWLAACRDLLLVKNHSEAYLANISAAKESGEIIKLDWNSILTAISAITEAKKMSGNNVSSKNILENLLLNI